MKQALARNTAQTTAVLALRILTQGAMLVASARLLGPENYGVYVAATALAAVLGIVPCLGSGFVMLARPDAGRTAASEVWRYAWPLSLATGSALCALYVPLAFALGGKYPLPLNVLFVIAATELVIAPIGVLLSNTLQAVHLVPLSQLTLWSTLALRALFMVPFFFLSQPFSLLVFVGFQALAAVLGLVLMAALAGRHVELNRPPRIVSLSEIRLGASYSLMHLMAANSSEIDKVVAASSIGSHEAGIYSATARVLGAALTPISALLLSAQPQLFRHRESSPQALKRLLLTMAASAFAWGCISWVALAYAGPVVAVAFGPAYERLGAFLPWLALAAGPIAMRMSSGTILVAVGKPFVRVGLELSGTLALVLLMNIWGPRFGLHGMAAALLCVELSMALIGWWLVKRLTARR